MNRLIEIWNRILFYFRRDRFERDLEEEMRFHLENKIKENIALGMSLKDAREVAKREFGNQAKLQQQSRETWGFLSLDTFWQDIKYGTRSLWKHRLLCGIVIATLSVGIGISTGVFSLISALTMRPPVNNDRDSFVSILTAYSTDASGSLLPGASTLDDLQAFSKARSLREVSGSWLVAGPIGDEDPTSVFGLMVTCNFFSVYGAEQAETGRLFGAEDCAQSNQVVVLSKEFWADRFGSDPSIIGKTIHYDGRPVTVIGITSSPFAGRLSRTNVWLPYTLDSYFNPGKDMQSLRPTSRLSLAGRLNAGFSQKDAATELNLISSQQDRLYPKRKTTLYVTNGSTMQDPRFGGSDLWLIPVIFLSVGLVALIACANVTMLLLSRANARQQEIAVRLALGAGRWRVVRMLLTETLILSAIAGIASVYLAYKIPTILVWYLMHEPSPLTLEPDWRVFSYLAGVTLIAGIISGMAPAWESLNFNLTESLKGNHRLLGRMAGGSRLRGQLIGGQVAMSFLLVAGLGVVAQARHHIATTDPGFDSSHLLVAQMHTFALKDNQRAQPQSWASFHRDLAERLRIVPGVESVTFHSFTYVDAQFTNQPKQRLAARDVSPGYFETMGIAILRGRELKENDPTYGKADACPVVVSEELVRTYFPGQDPLGKTIRPATGGLFEIVGVARDVSLTRIGRIDEPTIYRPWIPNSWLYQPVIRVHGDMGAVSRSITSAIRDVAPEFAVKTVTIDVSLNNVIEYFHRFEVLFGILGLTGLVLAVIGIYGVCSFSVSRRKKELGIRVALGAQSAGIFRAVLLSSVRPVIVGLIGGAILNLSLTPVVSKAFQSSSWLFQPYDPWRYAAVVAVLGTAALIAMTIPAWRATRVDPMEVLREE